VPQEFYSQEEIRIIVIPKLCKQDMKKEKYFEHIKLGLYYDNGWDIDDEPKKFQEIVSFLSHLDYDY